MDLVAAVVWLLYKSVILVTVSFILVVECYDIAQLVRNVNSKNNHIDFSLLANFSWMLLKCFLVFSHLAVNVIASPFFLHHIDHLQSLVQNQIQLSLVGVSL